LEQLFQNYQNIKSLTYFFFKLIYFFISLFLYFFIFKSFLLFNIYSEHIPYRDSKLTRVLQPALSGKAKVAVICTLSPCHSSYDESYNTLLFATRTKNVTTNAKVNEIQDEKALLNQYKIELTQLKLQFAEVSQKLAEMESKDNTKLNSSTHNSDEIEKLKREKQQVLFYFLILIHLFFFFFV